MAYHIAAVDVHKRMLAVVDADVAGQGEYQFERRKFGTTGESLRALAEWLVQQEVEEVVMESTAQYWKPVWAALEQYWKPLRQQREGAGKMSGTLHLCQAKSNRGRRGREGDFVDGERMVKRLVAQELVLSFVPDPEQRLWRTVTRCKYQLTRDNARQGTLSESTGELAGTNAQQAFELGVGPAGSQRAPDVAGAGGRRSRPGGDSRTGRLPAAGYAGATPGRPGGRHATACSLSSPAEDGTAGAGVAGRADRAIRPGGFRATAGASRRSATFGGGARAGR
jgi:hypothetical protein